MSPKKPKPARGRNGQAPKSSASQGSKPAKSTEPTPSSKSQPTAEKNAATAGKPKPKPPIACESSGGAPKTPKDRFYSGLIAGIAAALMLVVVIGGLATQVVGDAGLFKWGGSKETSSGPLLGLNAEGKGALGGWMIPTGVYALPAEDATKNPVPNVGTLGLYWPTSEASVTVTAELELLVGRSAKIFREGKPWDPPGDKKNSAAWRFLNQLYSEESTLGAEEHTITVTVYRANDGLVADSIDIGPALAAPEEEGLGEEQVIDLGAP